MNRTLHVLFEIQILSSPHGYVRSSIYLLHNITKSGRLWHQSSYEEARGSLSTSCICYYEWQIVPSVIRFRVRTWWVRIAQHFLEGREGRGRGIMGYFTFVNKLSLGGGGGGWKKYFIKKLWSPCPPPQPINYEWSLSDYPLSQPY